MDSWLKPIKTLYDIAFNIDDPFFERLVLKEAHSLLLAISEFRKSADEIKRKEIIIMLRNILKITDVIQYIKQLAPEDCLILKRDIMSLYLTVLIIDNSGQNLRAGNNHKSQPDATRRLSVNSVAGSYKRKRRNRADSAREDIRRLLSGGEGFPSKEIAQKLGITQRAVRRVLNMFIKEGIVKGVSKGRVVYYKMIDK